MKTFLIALGVIIILAVGSYFIIQFNSNRTEVINNTDTPKEITPKPGETATVDETTPAESTTPDPVQKTETEIGTSAGDHPIMAYHYGTGSKEILFIGGIHGGYSWNTTLVAYELMDYLKKNPSLIPADVKVTVVPVLNPDGLLKVVKTVDSFTKTDVSPSASLAVSGRFNGNTVDLNRNFDCDWKASGIWQNKTVSGGTAAFSEPESQAIRDYVQANDITAVVAWYSSAGGVFASNCHSDIMPETLALTNAFAKASGYKAYDEFDFYAITGDMVNWFAKSNIPAISVLLTNHTDTEWEKNRAGVEAILKYYAE